MSGAAGPAARARASLRALETLDRLTTAGAAPSAGDLEALGGWAGWGPMAPAFSSRRSGAWKQIGERLEWLLPPDQLREAGQATPNAFYTPPDLAASCWQILTGLGFERGRILEPGCGAGTFISATPPGVDADWIGVERDPVTAQIAHLLHPSAQIINERLQNAALPAHSADAVIGNVPFSDTPVYDPTAPREVARSLHNYCIWRAVRTLRPGGVAVLITSRYTMDARYPWARQEIAAEAALVGAIRLPGGALASGGTEVVTDIVVLRRHDSSGHDGGGPAGDAEWLRAVRLCDTYPDAGWHYEDFINQWFVSHPRMVLGGMRPDHAAQYGQTMRVDRDPAAGPLTEALARAATELVAAGRAAGLDCQPQAPIALDVSALAVPQRGDGRKERSFHLIGATVHQVRDGLLVPVDGHGKQLSELAALVRVRDAATALLDAEADYDRPDGSLAPLRAQLNAAYDRCVAVYGPLNRATIVTGEPDAETGLASVSRRRPRMGGFRQDPDYVTVLALEHYDDETGQASKAPIFTQRVNSRPRRPTHAGSADEAIRLCLDATGRLDLDVIGGLLGIPAARVPGELPGLAYPDPATGQWVTAEEYLSGNVRAKLETARTAAAAAHGEDAGRWAGNVAALEQVQPPDLGPGEIRAKLGAPWIPPGDVRAFAAELLGYPPAITCLPITAQWEVKAERGSADTAAATAEWGTGRIDAYRLLEFTLNGKAPVVYDTIQTPGGGERRERNQAESMLAEEKQRALSARFGEWVWEDPQRADRLCATYNRLFNSVVPRRYDGSHLTFPGMAAGFTPYPHQRDMVHRIISTPASLCPYPVGTGKTPAMFMAARKLRELGLARKPLIIVPNHLLEQTAAEGKRLFPSARILMATREDLADGQARKLFAARCATGDWDAVVMTHSAFTAIPVHPATEAGYLADLAARYRQALTAEPDGGKRSVKQLAKMIDAFETRARTLLDHRTDDGVFFEHLGADFLMVDESHYFKNLGVPVRTDGFSVAASRRASDLDMKLTALRERGGKAGALFTGTPVSNSLLEMYVLQHYLQPGRLEELGLHSADAWAATFVEFQTGVEVTPDGASFRMKRRPVKFENIPELLTLFGEVADLRPRESFAVQRPAASHHTIVIPAGPELRAYVASLAERADRLHQVQPHEDNMLKICGDGRKAALDLELAGVTTAAPSKVDAVISNVARIYHANRDLALPGDRPGGPRGGFQIVFCDLGTPDASGGPSVYGKIRDGLARFGVPARQIRFIHDAASDAQKTALFAGCRSGKVAVLLGSTDKLGVGTNIQARCVALHHVDAPWRPADVEQREGRALRPGNLNPSVEIFRYVSERSFDSFMWQTLERKMRFIGQVLGGRPTGRDIDDIGDPTLSYAEVKALATGNPLLLELAEANADVTRLRQLASGHICATRRLALSVSAWEQQAGAKTRLADACDRVAATAHHHAREPWRDPSGNPIPASDVPGHLGALAERALAGTGYGSVTWRGLRIVFSAQRDWRDWRLTGAISAGADTLTVDLNPAWTAKGQSWRIERELTSHLDGTATQASQLRAEAGDLRRRIADADKKINEPFPQAGELEAARARRDAIDQQIRAAAAPPTGEADGGDAIGEPEAATGQDRDGIGDLALASLDPGHQVTVFTPETAFVPDWQARPVAGGEPGPRDVSTVGGNDDAHQPEPEPAMAPGQEEIAAAGAGEAVPQAARPARPSSTPATPATPATAGAPGDLAGEPEELFTVPDTRPARGQGSRPGRTSPGGGRSRRTASQVAARDNAQPALFDLPPASTPGRARTTAGPNRTRAPRK